LAFGIGTTQVAHVLATQCLLQTKPPVMRVRVDGALRPGVTAKDLALALAAQIGVGGATGHVLEYDGTAVRALGMEGRMTLCNMAIELGARAGMVSPDESTYAWLRGRPGAPTGAAWDEAVARWRTLTSDPDATYGREVTIDADEVEPMVTWGTNPGMAVPVRGTIPDPARLDEGPSRDATTRALAYMGLDAGAPIAGTRIDVVFVGSCTNSRLADLEDVARVFAGRRVAAGVRALVVPGSERVKREAEARGIDRIVTAAGAEWREPGCSMCIAMNDDRLTPGQRAVSTSNRNFEGRQGRGGRTLLASPATAAAAAVAGAIVDPRPFLTGARA
ncbi:MAG TPA: aconitase family protein, partial [Gemmatimonadaceae bacterium]|nr:aconitase family protein [Gemmatimonadaceae bacterium]